MYVCTVLYSHCTVDRVSRVGWSMLTTRVTLVSSFGTCINGIRERRPHFHIPTLIRRGKSYAEHLFFFALPPFVVSLFF
jgi:hypothetical protein